jgi:ligand-binding sensor domain-containing protein
LVFPRNIRFLLSIQASILLLFSTAVFGQQPVFKNYSVKDGLPSSEVYHVMQDSKGYMWFCTDAGVSRYDGYSFKNFSSVNGLKDNTVFGSFEDKHGKIWFRTMSGRLFYFQNDSIYGIEANKRIVETLKNGLIASLYVDEGDTIWCGVNAEGFFKISPPYKNSNITFFNPEQSGFFIEIDRSGMIWGSRVPHADGRKLYHTGGIVLKYSKEGKRMEKLGNIEFSSSPSIIKTHSGKFIVTSYKDIVSMDKQDSFQVPGVRFLSLFEDQTFHVWAGTFRDGVYCFEGGAMKALPTHYLKGISVSSTTQDKEGGFWFTTLENGVFYMTSPGFLYFNKDNGLSENKTLAIIGIDSAHIIAGMENGELYLLSKVSSKRIKIKGEGPSEGSIYRFFRNSWNHKIIAGAPYSFCFSYGVKNSWQYLEKVKVLNAFKCFTQDRSGYIWAGNYQFLTKLDPPQKKELECHVSESRILSLYTDAGNTIWAGCVNGLWSFKNGKFRYSGTDNPLFRNRIDDIKVSADSTWWFATKGSGLIVKRKNEFLTIDEKKGLSSNICRSIFIDQHDVVWVGTNNGINRITMKKWGSPVVEVYSSDDGLLSNEINEVAKTGNLVWAATNQGIVVFDEKTAFLNQTPPACIHYCARN